MAVGRYLHYQKLLGVRSPQAPAEGQTIAEQPTSVQADTQESGIPMISHEREELDMLVTARAGLLKLATQIGNRGEHAQPPTVERAHKAVLKTLAAQLAKLEAAIAAKLDATAQFVERTAIIESVPGLARQTAAGLIAKMPELGRASGKVIAALLGAAPYDDDSGTHRGERHIKGGRQNLRNLFYMATLGAATQHNPVLKAYYQRLRAKGKEPKVALVACMRKLIVILNIMIARGEKWDPTKHVLA